MSYGTTALPDQGSEPAMVRQVLPSRAESTLSARTSQFAEAMSVRPPLAPDDVDAPPVARPAADVLRMVGKWASMGFLAGALVTGAGLLSRGETGLEQGTPTRGTLPAGPRVLPRSKPALFAPSEASPKPLDRAEPRANAAGGLRESASAPVASSDRALAVEIATVELAQRALRAGRPSAALEVLDGYDQRAGLARLGPAATVVRIEAHLALGQTDAARRLGEQLLAVQPQSALAERIRKLLASSRH